MSLQTNRVVARIAIGPAGSRLDPVQLVSTASKVLAVGTWTSGGALTNRNGLARLDPVRNRVEAATPLPVGPLVSTYGNGALWVGRVGGSTLVRIDPSTGK